MKNSIKIIGCLFVALFLNSISFAEVMSRSPVASPRYPGIKTEFDNAWAKATTREQKLKIMRDTVGTGRHAGKPVLNNAFKNFDPEFFKLDPDLPGVKETVKMIACDNKNKSKGHMRELLYANSIENDKRFKVISIGEKREYHDLERSNGPSGRRTIKGEADLVLEHTKTGQKIRMEVKNFKPSSQIRDLKKCQDQIRKMYQDFMTKGEMQTFVNRYKVIPELKDFAKKHGVKVFENISSKADPKLGLKSIGHVLDKTEVDCRNTAKISAITGSTIQASVGIYFAIQSAIKLKTDFEFFDGSKNSTLVILRDGAFFASGVSFIIGHASNLALQNKKWGNSTYLKHISKYAGRVGLVFAVLGEGFEIDRYARGYQTSREFWRGQSSMAGGLVGGAGAAFVAGKILVNIPHPLLRALGIAVIAYLGGEYGSMVGEAGTDLLYRFQDEKTEEKFTAILIKYYTLNN